MGAKRQCDNGRANGGTFGDRLGHKRAERHRAEALGERAHHDRLTQCERARADGGAHRVGDVIRAVGDRDERRAGDAERGETAELLRLRGDDDDDADEKTEARGAGEEVLTPALLVAPHLGEAQRVHHAQPARAVDRPLARGFIERLSRRRAIARRGRLDADAVDDGAARIRLRGGVCKVVVALARRDGHLPPRGRGSVPRGASAREAASTRGGALRAVAEARAACARLQPARVDRLPHGGEGDGGLVDADGLDTRLDPLDQVGVDRRVPLHELLEDLRHRAAVDAGKEKELLSLSLELYERVDRLGLRSLLELGGAG